MPRSYKVLKKFVVLLVIIIGISVTVPVAYADEPESADITITANKLKFKPDTVVIQTGETITLKMNNKGFVSHSYDILKPGAPETSSDTEDYILRTHTIPPDSHVITTFSIEKEGNYRFVCDVATHVKAGMKGILKVKEND